MPIRADGTFGSHIVKLGAADVAGADFDGWQSPEFLEDVATWAVQDDKPDPASVERVICQIYGDLHRWFYAAQQVPSTLVGCSHGDLHGRNILVGVRRGEAEFPVVYDCGEMSPRNVLVWDFVKLEMEHSSASSWRGPGLSIPFRFCRSMP